MIKIACTSISFIAIVLLLMERDPRKHIKIDLIKTKLIVVLTHDVTVVFGKSYLIANNSPSFETKVLHSIPIAPCIANISRLKLVCSTSKIFLL